MILSMCFSVADKLQINSIRVQGYISAPPVASPDIDNDKSKTSSMPSINFSQSRQIILADTKSNIF